MNEYPSWIVDYTGNKRIVQSAVEEAQWTKPVEAIKTDPPKLEPVKAPEPPPFNLADVKANVKPVEVPKEAPKK